MRFPKCLDPCAWDPGYFRIKIDHVKQTWHPSSLKYLLVWCGDGLYPSCCRPSPGDQETEAGLKPGFRQVQSTYISCNWSHLHLQASSSPELENSFRAFVEREKEIRSANKRQENWSNACQLGFEFVKTANIYAVDHNWPGLVDIWLFLLRDTNDIEVSQWVKILLRQKKIIQVIKATLTYNQFRIGLFILLHEKFLQFDWLRAMVFQLNLKITNL